MVQASWSVYYEQSPPHFKELFGDRPVHKNDTSVLPLQAADLLAWHIRRDYYEIEKGNIFSSPTIDALHSLNGVHHRWTKD